MNKNKIQKVFSVTTVLIFFVFYIAGDVKAQECPQRTLASKYFVRLRTDTLVNLSYQLQLTRIGTEKYSISLKDSFGRFFDGTAFLRCGEFSITLPVSTNFKFTTGGKVDNQFTDDVKFICMGFVQLSKTIKGTCSGSYSHIEGSKLYTFNYKGQFSARPT